MYVYDLRIYVQIIYIYMYMYTSMYMICTTIYFSIYSLHFSI